MSVLTCAAAKGHCCSSWGALHYTNVSPRFPHSRFFSCVSVPSSKDMERDERTEEKEPASCKEESESETDDEQ